MIVFSYTKRSESAAKPDHGVIVGHVSSANTIMSGYSRGRHLTRATSVFVSRTRNLIPYSINSTSTHSMYDTEYNGINFTPLL
jgi:hypothetical protein